MTRDQLRKLVMASDGPDWSVISGYAPTYFDSFSEVRKGTAIGPGGGDGTTVWLEHTAHNGRAVFVEDIDIGMVWGMRPTHSSESGSYEDWSVQFPDTNVQAHVVEVLYRGQPVDVEIVASIDGGRCTVPWPKPRLSGEINDPKVEAWEITQWEYDLARVLHQLTDPATDYADYVSRCGFTIVR